MSEIKEQPQDLLEEIFQKQKAFGSKFCPFGQIKHDEERWYWFNEFLDCVVDELMEVQGCLPWKHWKNYEDFEIDPVEIRFEIIDILHFVVSLALLEYISPEDIYRDQERDTLEDIIITLKGKVIYENSLDIDQATEEQLHRLTRDEIRKSLKAIGILYDGDPYLKNRLILDLFEYVFRLCAIHGMTGSDVYDYYCSKNEENFARQERGY